MSEKEFKQLVNAVGPINKKSFNSKPRSALKKIGPGKCAEPIISKKDFNRLRNAAKVITLDERFEALKKKDQEEEQMQNEFERMREHYFKIDEARRRAEANAMKNNVSTKNSETSIVLDRAFLAKHEQEEEVKRVNQIILNAKCHAVRDAQIQEKNAIQQQLKKEEERLKTIVQNAAKQHQNEEELRVEKQRQLRTKYASQIRQQLSERESLRYLEADRKEQEAEKLRKANEALKRDEDNQLVLNKERRAKFRAEIQKVLQVSQLFKRMLCEQERESDMRIAAYLKQKHERELALAAERKLAKEVQERRQQRVFLVGQKILASKSKQEEMGYLREQERIEREYRRKEKELSMRKIQIERELAKAREIQLLEIKKRESLQIASEERDFSVLIQKLKEGQEKQHKADEEREKRRRRYNADIVRQISDREKQRQQLKELELDQSKAWKERERQRDDNIKAVINAKLQAMRNANLPEKYIRDVQIQLDKLQERKKKN